MCGGDGSKCKVKTKSFRGSFSSSRVATAGSGSGKKLLSLQRGARKIKIVMKKMPKVRRRIVKLCYFPVGWMDKFIGKNVKI